MKFTYKEFKNYSSSGSFKLNSTTSLNKVFEKIVDSQNEKEIKDPSNFTEEDFIYKVCVLLETRYSKKIQNFDYSKMKDDVKILKFKELILKKLKKSFP